MTVSVSFVDIDWFSVFVVFLNLAAIAGIGLLVYHYFIKPKKNRSK